MKTSIVKVGNPHYIRIPKKILEELRPYNEIDLVVGVNALVIRPTKAKHVDSGILLSYSALAKEWDTPEEDQAWAYLQ